MRCESTIISTNAVFYGTRGRGDSRVISTSSHALESVTRVPSASDTFLLELLAEYILLQLELDVAALKLLRTLLKILFSFLFLGAVNQPGKTTTNINSFSRKPEKS